MGPNLTFVNISDDSCLIKNNPVEDFLVYTIKSPMIPHRKALRLCQSLGGSMLSPENFEELQVLKESLKSIPATCTSIWMPIFKHYKNWNTGDSMPVNFTNWHPGQPNGGAHAKKCAIVDEEFEY